MDWTIEFEQDAIRQLNRLDKTVRRRVVQFLDSRVVATGDPRQLGKALHGELAGFWRYRAGDYRLICLLEDERRVVSLGSNIVAASTVDGRPPTAAVRNRLAGRGM